MSKTNFSIDQLKHKLVVSCQSLAGSPMDRTDIVAAMAQAAVEGGAAAVRIEGVANVRAVASLVGVPVIGIVKRDLDDSSVRITPFEQDVKDLAAAGATIIAFDATRRLRPVTVERLLQVVRSVGCIAMADCATEADGLRAWQLGCELVGTTLSGYTDETQTDSEAPDFELVARLASAGCLVVAEGRFRTPEHAARALEAGAYSVTVGSAITRIEHITSWFIDAMDEVSSS
jgi:N-acylglucosamine-6-phosphate 2-epimerase